MLACSSCGGVQVVPELPPRAAASCYRCEKPLARAADRSVDAALAFALATLVLLGPANLFPLLRVTAVGLAREGWVISGPVAMVREGEVLVGVAMALFTVVIPVVRAALLVLVLGAIRSGRELPRAGAIFRWAEELRPWDMAKVALLAIGFSYIRITEQGQSAVHMDITIGGFSLVAVVLLGFATEAALERRAVWGAIGRERALAPGEEGVPCDACELVVPAARAGEPCPRCGRRLARVRPETLGIAAALVIAAAILYGPCYAFPMSTDTTPQGIREHTILSATDDLVRFGFWYLAIIVVIASMVIPLLKLGGLAWLMVRARRPEGRRLRFRTRLTRVIREIGPWSMTDPLIIGTTVPLLAFPGLVAVHTAPAVTPFFLVVVLTMLAARLFDPRLMWNSVEEARPR